MNNIFASIIALLLCVSTQGCSASSDTATQLMASNLMVDASQIHPDATLGDLTSDPLSVVETMLVLEDEYGTSIDDPRLVDMLDSDSWKSVTVAEFLSLARGQ